MKNPIKFALGLALFISSIAQLTAGWRPERLDRIRPAMEAELAAHHTAGAVTLVLRNGKIAHFEASGFADREAGKVMNRDSVFWIASMTKSMSATVILSLVDDGKLSLDAPASKWLPALAKVKLADGTPPARPITLRDLMSHTSGLAFPARKPTDGAQSLKAYVSQLLKGLLEFEPGSNYRYGFGITVSGRIAEIVTGKSFDALMQERLLAPLGMNDTSFNPDDRLRARIAQTYKTAERGKVLALAYNPFLTSDARIPRMIEPSGGLFSTAADLSRFYQMILNNGMHDGKRIVSQGAIAVMTAPHSVGDRLLNYGLGWMCNNPKRQSIRGFSDNAFGHGGAFTTHGWVDPKHKIVTVFMTQNVLVKDGRKSRDAFLNQVVSAIASPAK
jgi:CubicO group peptidase (beta-lactamase class C family)